MKRRSTTRQLSEAISNNLLQVTKAECYHKTTRQTDPIDAKSFLENLKYLCESGCFMDCVGWHFEKDYKTNQYIAECCRMNGDSENIVTVHLRMNDGASDEDINNILIMKED